VLLLLLSIPFLFVLSGFGGPSLNPWGFDATGRYAPPLWAAAAVIVGIAASRAWRRVPALSLVAVAALLLNNVVGYVRTDPLVAFQSPYWSKLPADSGPLLDVLRQEGVDAVWLNHWAAFPVTFDARAAGQRLVAYDWYDVQAGGIDRFPEYLPVVRAASRAGYVLVTDEDRPELLQRLDEMKVQYTVRRAPPYVVVIPESRTVDPSEVTGALDYRY
jgi:hypothetical protein